MSGEPPPEPPIDPSSVPPSSSVPASSAEPGSASASASTSSAGAASSSEPASTGGTARVIGPSAVLLGAGHVIVHGNAAVLDAYGRESVGQPAREALTDLPPIAFALMDRVLADGRPLATRITLRGGGGDRRLVVAPRRELESAETYGVAIHLRPVRDEAD